jgi:hypothetical protein
MQIFSNSYVIKNKRKTKEGEKMDKTNWGQLTQLGDGLRMMEERRDSAIPPSSLMSMVGDDVSLHNNPSKRLYK